MSRNGSGVYNLPAGNPVVTGTTIASTWANNTMNDIASALTDSVAADGQTPMTGDLDLNTNKIINLDPATVAGDAVEYAQFVAATTNAVAITGGTINGATIGVTTPASGRFTTLEATGAFTAGSTAAITGNTTVGGTLTVTGAGAFNGTGALKIPAGTTAEQPTPTTGMIRYNSSLDRFEGYTNSQWSGFGSSAAGSNTQVQYNNNGVLAGSSSMTFSSNTLTVTTLASTNLSDGTNSTSTTNAVRGSAKAWVNFNGSNGSIRTSYNVSSVVKNTTGDYTVNFTNSLADADYDVNGNTSYGPTRACIVSLFMQSGGGAVTPTSSSFRFMTLDSANNAQDLTYVCLSIFR